MVLEEKVALVTGGAARIGRVIVRKLAAAGCDVVIHYNESAADAAALSEELKLLGRQAWIVGGDLSEEGEPENVMRSAWDLAGWVDILVNNAAAYSRDPFEEAARDEYEKLWRINALAPALLSKTFAECIASSDILPADYTGHVINILDSKVASADLGALPYWMSKKALEAFTTGGALELAPAGITVNGIAPGPVLVPAAVSGDQAGSAPLARRCTPNDVADAVVYLASSDAVTGQILYIDSGRHIG